MRAFAPGRVNLIGDHTDYTGGLALPMAVAMGTTVTGRREGSTVRLSTDAYPEAAVFDLPVARPLRLEGWARYAEAVAAVVSPPVGFTGHISSDLPLGAGLSSSASLEVALALALGHEGCVIGSVGGPVVGPVVGSVGGSVGGSVVEAARDCQQAEMLASGVPCGIMDQLVSLAGVEGHALLLDCASLAIEPVPVAADAEIVVIHSGEERALAGSAYADRRRACEEAASIIGPLRAATLDQVAVLADPVLRARARHVVSENARVQSFAAGLREGDLHSCGRLMVESHRSLADDFEVSTDRLDRLVEDLVGRPGVYGARLTGAGFGGCVVALTRPGALTGGGGVELSRPAVLTSWGRGWAVRPAGGAYVEWDA